MFTMSKNNKWNLFGCNNCAQFDIMKCGGIQLTQKVLNIVQTVWKKGWYNDAPLWQKVKVELRRVAQLLVKQNGLSIKPPNPSTLLAVDSSSYGTGGIDAKTLEVFKCTLT